MKLIFIVGPFGDKDGWVVNCNIHEAEKAAAIIITDGRSFPIASHSLCANFQRTGNDGYWLKGTLELMRRCDALFALPNWQKSAAARSEIAEAEQQGIPVFYNYDQLFRYLSL